MRESYAQHTHTHTTKYIHSTHKKTNNDSQSDQLNANTDIANAIYVCDTHTTTHKAYRQREELFEITPHIKGQ